MSLAARIRSRWTAEFTYSFSSFEFDRFRTNGVNLDGNTLPGTPRHMVYSELAYQHDTGWFAVIDGLFTDKLFVDNDNTVTDDASIVVNTRTGFERSFGNWEFEVYAGINNLFDETYDSNVLINAFGGRFFEPAPGLNAYGGFQLSYRLSAQN